MMTSVSKVAAPAVALLSGVLLAGCLQREVVCKCHCNGQEQAPSEVTTGERNAYRSADSDALPSTGDSPVDIDAPPSTDNDLADTDFPSTDDGLEDIDTPPSADGECTEEIVFKDEQFETLVRKKLRKPRGPITGDDVASITELYNEDGNGRPTKITDLSGIQCFRRLESLTLKGIDGGEIGKLSGLRWLRQLDLSDSGLRDISALSGLGGLRELNLSGNRITDIGPLRGLRGLRKLYLNGNGLRETAGLERLVGLEILSLDGNRIADIGFVKALSNLRELRMANNMLTDLDPFVDAVPRLEWLVLSGNRIRDVSALSRTAQKRRNGGVLLLRSNKINCEGSRRDLVAVSVLWAQVGIECEEFNTAGP
jgi:hypothetical protein